jgi:hypothetical protein
MCAPGWYGTCTAEGTVFSFDHYTIPFGDDLGLGVQYKRDPISAPSSEMGDLGPMNSRSQM